MPLYKIIIIVIFITQIKIEILFTKTEKFAIFTM